MNPTNLLTSVAAHIDPRYGTGTTKVWYMKPSFSRDGGMGVSFLKEYNLLPELHLVGGLERTHTLVGALDVEDLEEAYDMMQGERWSPRGEARGLISGLGLDHTSMMVGDIVQKGDEFFMVDRMGFTRIP